MRRRADCSLIAGVVNQRGELAIGGTAHVRAPKEKIVARASSCRRCGSAVMSGSALSLPRPSDTSPWLWLSLIRATPMPWAPRSKRRMRADHPDPGRAEGTSSRRRRPPRSISAAFRLIDVPDSVERRPRPSQPSEQARRRFRRRARCTPTRWIMPCWRRTAACIRAGGQPW